jgi:transposase, IS5 family
MLRLTTDQPDFWDYLLPEEARRMHPELLVVDEILDDPRFLAPFLGRFSDNRGRYTIPMETYLRMMYLKTKYQLGYESLVEEVTDSVSWRRFCRISLSGRVPDASTLIKLTNGPCQGLVDEVHDALVQELARKKVLRGRKVRVDTTVVEADIHYPTDADLLADGVRVVTRTVKRLQQAGVATGVRFRNVTRSVRKRLQQLAKGLKQGPDKKKVARAEVTTEVLGITRKMLQQAQAIEEAARQWVTEQGAGVSRGIHRRVEELGTWLERTQRVVAQTKQVLGGNPHVRDRLISLFDPDARPIRKGKLKAPTEFGYKPVLSYVEGVVVADEDRGFITDYQVLKGNPSDKDLLVAPIKRHTERVGKVPREVAVDRGMASEANDLALQTLGVEHRSLPKTGKKDAAEQAREASSWFRRLQRFRAGGEGRISLLKRRYGWRRSRLRGYDRVKTWIGWGAITHNLTKYARLQLAKAA